MGTKLLRGYFINTFTVWGLILVFSACSLESTEDRKSGQAAVTDTLALTSGGYSIFNETMADMTWQEVEKAAKTGAIILLPTAVIEEHGPHMGCGVDTYLAYQTCKMVRRDLASLGINALIAPTYFWGINRTTHVFPGTFTVRDKTMQAGLTDILTSLKSWGFNYIFNINWHYDGAHLTALLRTIIGAQQSLGINARFMIPESDVARFRFKGDEPFLLMHKDPPIKQAASEFIDLHAGAGETGIMAAHFPDQVDLDLTRKLEPTRLTMNDIRDWVANAREVTPLGYLGNPAAMDIPAMAAYHKDFSRSIAKAIAALLQKEDYKTTAPFAVPFEKRNYSVFSQTMVDMTWAQVEKAAVDGAVVLLNTAVIEEHGPHMVNGIDAYIGYLWCKMTRIELESKGVKTLIAPPFYWGINRSNHDFPGTFSSRDQTMEDLLYDAIACLKSWGFTRVYVINSHGDGQHIAAVIKSLKKAITDLELRTCLLFSEERGKQLPYSSKDPFILFFKSSLLEKSPPQYIDVHAGWLETGIAASYFPGLVDVEMARKLKPTRLAWEEAGKWIKSVRKTTPLGYAGDPASFDSAGAVEYVQELSKNMADAIARDIKN